VLLPLWPTSLCYKHRIPEPSRRHWNVPGMSLVDTLSSSPITSPGYYKHLSGLLHRYNASLPGYYAATLVDILLIAVRYHHPLLPHSNNTLSGSPVALLYTSTRSTYCNSWNPRVSQSRHPFDRGSILSPASASLQQYALRVTRRSIIHTYPISILPLLFPGIPSSC